jgi:hypothetical protein
MNISNGILHNGFAQAEFISPSIAGNYEIWAECLDATSETKEVSFSSAIKSFDLEWSKNQIKIKNILSSNDHLTADGTPVLVGLKNRSVPIDKFLVYTEKGSGIIYIEQMKVSENNQYLLIIDILGLLKTYQISIGTQGEILLVKKIESSI